MYLHIFLIMLMYSSYFNNFTLVFFCNFVIFLGWSIVAKPQTTVFNIENIIIQVSVGGWLAVFGSRRIYMTYFDVTSRKDKH